LQRSIREIIILRYLDSLRALAERAHMQTKDLQASEEKRAYFRLLRYLVTNDFQASDREEQARPLQPRITDFLKQFEFEHYEPSKIH
jgi:hypothetical protein